LKGGERNFRLIDRRNAAKKESLFLEELEGERRVVWVEGKKSDLQQQRNWELR